jgi:prepilin-type N-terminal cleavage/methylation domain-containing protein
MNRRKGFTFIEILMVMIIIGLLSSLGILKYIDLKRQAYAVKIASEISAVRVGAFNYWADFQDWPPDVGPGVAPPPLVPYLPGFTFAGPDYTLDWDNLTGGGGGAFLVGITMSTMDTKLLNSVKKNLGTSNPWFLNGNSLTYIIVGPSGVF